MAKKVTRTVKVTIFAYTLIDNFFIINKLIN